MGTELVEETPKESILSKLFNTSNSKIHIFDFIPKIYDAIGKTLPKRYHEAMILDNKSSNLHRIEQRTIEMEEAAQCLRNPLTKATYQYECLYFIMINVSRSRNFINKDQWNDLTNWYGDVNEHFLDTIQQFIEDHYEYFHGIVSDIEDILKRYSPRHFLLRYSDSKPGAFTISYTPPRISNDVIERPRHARIYRKGEGIYLYDETYYKSVKEIIEELKTKNLIETPVHGDFWFFWEHSNEKK